MASTTTGNETDVSLGRPNETETSTEQQSEGSRLRQERNDMKTQRDEFRKELLSVRLEQLGLKPDEGLGVAIMEGYNGAPDKEALITHLADKYRYEVPAEIEVEKVTQPADRISQVVENSAPVEPPVEVDQVVEAEAKMHDPEAGRVEAQDALATKMQRYRQLRNQISP